MLIKFTTESLKVSIHHYVQAAQQSYELRPSIVENIIKPVGQKTQKGTNTKDNYDSEFQKV